MSVILLDVDHFKTFNDSYGHIAGDDCLRRLAASVNAVIEDDANACAVRFGGEEFLIFLESTGTEAATRTAERLTSEIAKTAIPHPVLGEGACVTASMGVATGTAPDVSLDTLVAAADDALYAAKRAGRDRISSVVVDHGMAPIDQQSSGPSPVWSSCLAETTAECQVHATPQSG